MKTESQEKLIEYFEKVKEKAITKYNLEGLTDEEIKSTLFKIYTLEYENVKNDIEKIIILDYSENFLDEIATPLMSMLNQIKPGTNFSDNQNLFSMRNKITRINKTLTEITLDKYNYSYEEGMLVDQTASEQLRINSQLLKEILMKEKDLFELPKPQYPELRARHELRESNYNINYWTEYIQTVDTKRQNIINYFEETGKLEEIEQFMNIASLYYNYITNYDRINNLKQEKRKTL